MILMTTFTKSCRDENKRQKKNKCIYKKINDSRLRHYRMSEYEVKPEIGNIFVNEIVLKEYSLNPICPGVFLSNHAPRGRKKHSVPSHCINPDGTMLLT